MLKTIKIIVMAALCLNFSNKATAQTPENKAIDITAKGLQIGQKVPEITLTNIHNYKDANGKPITTTQLSDFKGKLIILDFWATWCGPCIAMIPKMNELQQKFNDKLQIITVTYEKAEKVIPFLQKLQNGKPSILLEITDDKSLKKIFPHSYVPHYVWIDKEGIVKAITGYEEISTANIQAMINGQDIQIKQKKDLKISYDRDQPFIVKGNGGDGSNLLYHSLLTGYVDGIGYGFTYKNEKDSPWKKVSARNYTIPKLFQLAYSGEKSTEEGFFSPAKLRVIVKDSSKVLYTGPQNFRPEWLKRNAFCYELLVPASMGRNLFPMMQQELKKLFSAYAVSIEKHPIPSWVLKRTSTADKLNTKGGPAALGFHKFGAKIQNQPLDVLVARLAVIYQQDAKLPFKNGTAYQNRVDLEINADLADMQAVNAELKKYDLQFIEEKIETDILTIRDADQNNPATQITTPK